MKTMFFISLGIFLFAGFCLKPTNEIAFEIGLDTMYLSMVFLVIGISIRDALVKLAAAKHVAGE